MGRWLLPVLTLTLTASCVPGARLNSDCEWTRDPLASSSGDDFCWCGDSVLARRNRSDRTGTRSRQNEQPKRQLRQRYVCLPVDSDESARGGPSPVQVTHTRFSRPGSILAVVCNRNQFPRRAIYGKESKNMCDS
jgi:hypothetical protein